LSLNLSFLALQLFIKKEIQFIKETKYLIMTDTIRKTLRDSKSARWTALVVVSLSMFGAYFFNYAMSPVKPMLESQLGWNSADFGLYTSSYGWFNVFLFMLIFSGIILDKLGIRITGLGATFMMALGTGINYWAITTAFPAEAMVFGIKAQVAWSCFGFAIFGVGTEAAGITVSKAVVRWFKGKEMALAMGMQMSIARLGTALALGIALPLAKNYSYATPILVAFVFMLISIVTFFFYIILDKRLDASEAHIEVEEEDPFKLKDIILIVTNKAFWFIAILCVLFYGAVFPFLFYATDLMINKYHVDPYFAGIIPGLLPFGTILLTPLFGGIYDKKGKGATIMIIGSLILILVHGFLSLPGITSWMFATVMVIILGVGFSLVPAAMWPSVPKIIPEKQLGTAYAVIFWIQNIGLLGIPLLLGIVLNTTNPDVAPNKALIKNAVEKSFDKSLSASALNFSPKEIEKAIEKTTNGIIDSIVQSISYEPTMQSEIDTASISAEISAKTLAILNTIDKNGDKNKVLAKAIYASKHASYDVVAKNKLNIRYNYQVDMLIFTLLGILGLLFAFLLKAEDKKKGYGLELPNIEK